MAPLLKTWNNNGRLHLHSVVTPLINNHPPLFFANQAEYRTHPHDRYQAVYPLITYLYSDNEWFLQSFLPYLVLKKDNHDAIEAGIQEYLIRGYGEDFQNTFANSYQSRLESQVSPWSA